MSFDNGGGSPIGMAKECRVDHEAQAKEVKKSLTSTTNLKASLMNFIENNDTYKFNNISSIAEFLGGLVIVEKSQLKNYEHILSLVEKSK